MLGPVGRTGVKLAVLISGAGTNLQAIIDAINSRRLNAEIALVVSSKPGALGVDRALAAGLDVAVLPTTQYASREEYDEALVALLEQCGAELVVLAGFMRILSSTVIDRFPNRIINLHPSLLPAFPGIHAQRQAVDYGVKVTGCTVHFVDQGLDSGPIIIQKTLPVVAEDTEKTVSDRLRNLEHEAIVEAIGLYGENRLRVRERRVIIDEGVVVP